MNPDIEDFLNSAFQSIQPTSPAIGRVVVQPDYDADASSSDQSGLQNELLECLRSQSPDGAALGSHNGYEVGIPATSGLLSKYVRSITLHGDKLDGSWVEVSPPGNWI